MRITFAVPGKIKNTACIELIQYYVKLIGKFADVSIQNIAVPEANRKSGNLDSVILEFLEKRGPRVALTVLDEKGRTFTSKQFSAEMEKIKDSSPSEWIILCGSEHGYGADVKAKARQILSLSQLTFPHEMALAVITEQVFRGFTILNNQPYHND